MSDDDPHENYSLLLAFDTNDRQFVRGVQVGMLWKAAQLREDATVMMYADNAEMIARIREACPLVSILVTEANDDWLQVRVVA